MKTTRHFMVRRRAAQQSEPYPARSRWLRALDRLILIVGVLGPLTALPQVVKIYTLKDAAGVSMLSWLLPAIVETPWVVYGIVHREKPIVITYVLWIVIDLMIVAGALIYGSGPL